MNLSQTMITRAGILAQIPKVWYIYQISCSRTPSASDIMGIPRQDWSETNNIQSSSTKQLRRFTLHGYQTQNLLRAVR